jgi:hypothetical protein
MLHRNLISRKRNDILCSDRERGKGRARVESLGEIEPIRSDIQKQSKNRGLNGQKNKGLSSNKNEFPDKIEILKSQMHCEF